MRRTAYIKALEEASQLPESIPELERYFKIYHNPRLCAIAAIKEAARKDVEALFDSELVDVLNWPDQSVRRRLDKLIEACITFLKSTGFEDWKSEVDSVTANFKDDKQRETHHIGTMPFLAFNQAVRELSYAKDHQDSTNNNQAQA